ncbi:MAG TPA: DUF5683 domain-containing protein [Flavobacteriaceae bacterium]|nr:hypothetical protein [Flavobacteriaceae bacterium]MCB9212445.1 hypothetical protein [Alteromonas sp.]HPF11721.1 DUF5683 domain-containing protein [Flavobacteriaceae bacterium]HQU20196.1 DUF5683 domain-containing protein [Flavobacteriaceae bacterium]
MRIKLFHIFFFLISHALLAQSSDSLKVQEEKVLVVRDTLTQKDVYDPLAPSRAAFYSAVLPGLGQAYNKKYWKIPIIYAGMGTGIYFYLQNTDEYNRFRDAYKRRLAGYTDDEFQGVSTSRLIDAQKTAGRNRDVSIIVSLMFYMLNIVDANVDAHLRQYNISEDLSLQPSFEIDPTRVQPNYGLSLTFNLK